MTLKIQIITAADETFDSSGLMSRLAVHWRDAGYEVVVGPADRLDADIGILHIVRTWVDNRFLPRTLNGKLLLNGEVLDISKRNFSNLILGPDTDFDGPVIIKTNGNCFELPERTRLEWLLFYKWRQMFANQTSWRIAHDLPGTYPVLQHPKDVPAWVWNRNDLVVESFVPEMDGDLYVLRMWLFFGDREYGAKIWCTDPIVKSHNILRYEYIYEVPHELRDMRKRLSFDFGKFDYVMVNGEPVLLDVNKTPMITSSSNRSSPNIINLAQGIHAFL